MKIAIVVIGDELLLGQVADVNSSEIARRFTPYGVTIESVAIVGDDGAAMRRAIADGLAHADAVITTGGLGPTRDDITKSVMMEIFGGELRLDKDMLRNVEEVFRRRGLKLYELTRTQAMVPTSCTPIANAVGTAPIMWFERDDKVQQELKLDKALVDHIDQHIADCEKEMDDDAESIITNQRYAYINTVVEKAVRKKARVEHLTVSDKIDQVVTNRIFALPIFALIMFLMYALSMGTSIADGGISIGSFATDWTNDVLFGEIVPNALSGFLESVGVAGWLYGLIMDGIVAGVGAVLGFVPQMLVLFFLLSILEDIGYMARVAFIMDRIFRKFGLSGKSFIPILVGTGCGVPGVMASRTIENERDRRMTIMTTCFIPCGAKMPIIGLIAGALFGGSSWVATSAYFIGFAAIIISGIILKKTKLFAGDPAPFVMELPAYHVPAWGNVLRATWERGWSFIKRAGTVILAATIILWFLQGFGFENGAFTMVEDQDNSILAIVASAISWIFIPQGFGNWRATVASISGLIAKENVVGTFGVLYHYADELSDNGDEIWPEVAASFTAISAYSFMIFNLLCAPCFAAMGAIKREMNNGKWTAIAIGYMCLVAYCASLVVYQIGGLITGEVGFNIFTIVAVAIIVFTIYMLVRPNKYLNDNEVKIDVKKVAASK